jgi:glycosyltransferase involved in cell wall biosynthesis
MNSTGNSPRILFVSSVWPDEAVFGGALRSSNILRALQQMGTVELLILDDKTSVADLKSERSTGHTVASTFEIKPRPNKSLIERLRWTFDPRSDYPNGCGVGQDALRSALHRMEEFDLIWFFQLRCADAFPNAAWRRSVLDIDNLPSMYERATLQAGGGKRDRFLASRRLLSWRRRERLLGDRFEVLAVCSEEDRNYLRQIGIKVPIHVIPNGFEQPVGELVRIPVTPPRIGFIGLFEYFPNRQGIHWFVNECWPRIKAEVPNARLRLVGRDSDGPLKPLGEDIDGLGWVANPSNEMSTWSALIVPLHIGAGTRIKIAHGFSQKCPIVSTSLGAYGYGAVDGRELYLADSAETFSKACIQAIRKPEIAAQMAERAWHLFIEKWTWEAIRPSVWAAAEECLRKPDGLQSNYPNERFGRFQTSTRD